MAKKKIGKGRALREVVKGSLDYAMRAIREAFGAQFPATEKEHFFVEEIFADYVIAKCYGYGEAPCALAVDEYFRVAYSPVEGGYRFAEREDWELVELSYTPAQQSEPLTASHKKKTRGERITERLSGAQVQLVVSERGGRRVRVNEAIVADVINGNGRRYPARVIAAAVEEMQQHLHESAGQGRALQMLGEAEHPADKGTRRPNLLETVVKWDDVSFDGLSVSLGGQILETQKGKDILALMEGGVVPGVSLRGYGKVKKIREGGMSVMEVRSLTLTGFDFVLEPSFQQAAAVLESVREEDDMTQEELLALLKENRELFGGVTEAQLREMNESQLAAIEKTLREKLGIGAEANIGEALDAALDAQRQLAEMKRTQAIEAAVSEAVADLPYGEEGNTAFEEALRAEAAELADGEAVHALVERKRAEYDRLFAPQRLNEMGLGGGTGAQVLGSVLERETGTPEYARGAFALSERIRRVENRAARNWQAVETSSEVFTLRLLERFDKLWRQNLISESQMLREAEQTSDLNLPYSVSRAVIEEAFPDLISANVFDVGIMTASPGRLYYEEFSGESGYTASVTDESVTADLGAWVNLANRGRLTPSSVTVTDSGATTTYAEGTDYVIDYAGGRIKALSGGSISDGASILVDYSYTAVRKGEMAAIERGKITLSYKTVEAMADRLADQISREAIVFSRSQLGMDASAQTLKNLTKQLRRKIDQGMLYMAWSAVKSVASNSGGTWTSGTDTLDELVEKIGLAKVKVAGRYWTPTFLLMSVANADILSNWSGFKRDGFPNAILNAAGFAGGVKGLPIFASTEFPDSEVVVGNKQLVQHMVYQPMLINGPFPSYDSSGKLIAADQYYAEEFNVTESLVANKGAYVVIA